MDVDAVTSDFAFAYFWHLYDVYIVADLLARCFVFLLPFHLFIARFLCMMLFGFPFDYFEMCISSLLVLLIIGLACLFVAVLRVC